ncbi:MAG: hypothetical protein HY564_00075 [Candidatus Jacksonbacteria bacterium]|nr:hypothetical protein [Candidatus Jacksonbacteria bacterium]
MKIARTRSFKKEYEKLEVMMRDAVDKKLILLLKNSRHPSLRFKKVKGHAGIWEISITMHYRLLLLIEDNCYTMLRIGTHDILNKI